MPDEYPKRLLWNGRTPDQEFLPDELLYYRVTGFGPDNLVDGPEIHCLDTSVNRGKFSEPADVLITVKPPMLDKKVARFLVKEIPKELLTGDNRKIGFLIVHDPVLDSDKSPENYAHCEIRAFGNGARLKKLTDSVCKQYKMFLRSVMIPAAD